MFLIDESITKIVMPATGLYSDYYSQQFRGFFFLTLFHPHFHYLQTLNAHFIDPSDAFATFHCTNIP